MSRILEYQRSDQATVVSRMLLELHRTIDKEFPKTKAGSRQFTKTVLTTATSLDVRPGTPESSEQVQKDALDKVNRQDSHDRPSMPQAPSSAAASMAFPLASSVPLTRNSEVEFNTAQSTHIDGSSATKTSSLKKIFRLFLLSTFLLGLCVLGWLILKGQELPAFLKESFNSILK